MDRGEFNPEEFDLGDINVDEKTQIFRWKFYLAILPNRFIESSICLLIIRCMRLVCTYLLGFSSIFIPFGRIIYCVYTSDKSLYRGALKRALTIAKNWSYFSPIIRKGICEVRKAIYENDTFRLGGNIRLNACVGNNGFPDLHTYQLGYYKAAIALIKSVKKSTYNVDSLVYPIVFSARHAIELFFKDQLYNLKYINDKAQGKEFEYKIQKTHNISDLWQEYKELTKVDIRYEPYISALEEYMVDFCEVDDTGETFRYPFDHEEVRHLTDFGCINIEIFEKRFIKLYEIVEELGYLTDFLIHEYKECTVISGLSRQQIKEIALELPPKEDWIQDNFLEIKKEILQKHRISSNKFSKALTLIKNHKEFASYVGIEISLKEIGCDDLKKFIALFRKYRNKFKTDDYVNVTQVSHPLIRVCDM